MREQRVELVEFRLRGFVVGKSRSTLYLSDGRIKRAVGVLRRAEIAQAGVRFGSEAFQQRRRQSRLADTGLAGEQHHLTFAGLRLRPAPQQQFEFFFPPDEVGQAARVQSLEAASPGTARRAAKARTGPAMPLRSLGPRSSSSNRLPRSFRVLSAMTTVFGSAMLCRRAARFGVSPTMACS